MDALLSLRLTVVIDLPEEALPGLLHLIFLTYTRYQDRESRLAVLEVLKELNKWNSSAFQHAIVPSLTREVERTDKKSPDGYSLSLAMIDGLYCSG